MLPGQLLLAAGDAATLKPVARSVVRLSVKLLIVAARVDGLLRVMVSVVASPAAWVAGANDLLTAAAVTASEAVEAPLLLPRLVTRAPLATVLV